jgi:hypothetical protein
VSSVNTETAPSGPHPCVALAYGAERGYSSIVIPEEFACERLSGTRTPRPSTARCARSG